MSLASVRRHLEIAAPELTIIETDQSSATVELAAAAYGVAPGQIAKTLSFQLKDQVFLVVARGDARMSNVDPAPQQNADPQEAEDFVPRARRARVYKKGKMVFQNGLRSIPCVVRNISDGGAMPNIATALLAGGMLAFALSFDEVIVTTFTAGQQQTLPIWMLEELVRPRQRPVTNVVALLVVLVTFVPILAAYYLTRGTETVAGQGK